MMGKVLAMMNEKGGVGKSALTFSCAWYMAEQGKNVLLVDMDGQMANLTYLAGVKTDEMSTKTVADILMRDADPAECIESVTGDLAGRLDLIPATVQMAALPSTAKISKMKKTMRALAGKYDYVFLDVNPSPDWRHALTLSVLDGICIVMLPDIVSLEANRGIFDSIEEVREGTNTGLQILGFVLNQFDTRTRLSRAVVDKAAEMADLCGSSMLQTKVRKTVVMPESATAHVGVTAYAPKAPVADDIRQLADELMARI